MCIHGAQLPGLWGSLAAGLPRHTVAPCPGLQGNRTPHTDALSRGTIAGLTLAHGRGHVFRALIESICYGGG